MTRQKNNVKENKHKGEQREEIIYGLETEDNK